VDNSRILLAATEVVKAGGLGNDISDLPAAGSAPEWMSEKAISIGQYFVSSGVYTVFGATFPTSGAPVFRITCFKIMEKCTAACGIYEPDPIKHARKDDRPYRQEAQGTGHRQGPGARADGYGRPSGRIIALNNGPSALFKYQSILKKSSTKEEHMSKISCICRHSRWL
jgi:hypothetical protein